MTKNNVWHDGFSEDEVFCFCCLSFEFVQLGRASRGWNPGCEEAGALQACGASRKIAVPLAQGRPKASNTV